MKKLLLSIAALIAGFMPAFSIDNNTVEIVYNGDKATVSIASNISSYISVTSGSSSHVRLVQDDSFAGVDKTVDNTDGEIIYVLSGTSTDGEFYMEGSFKCTVELNGVTLSNPEGPAINIQNGKRITVSAQKGTVNTLSDGANNDYNGCIHCKGHLELKGRGTLNVAGLAKHGIYSKEYMEIKNLTLNVTSSVKDALHCKEFFWMKSGVVTLNNAGDDAIQVELSNDPTTGVTDDHEDENTGNFYMTGGTLTINDVEGKAVKADGTIAFTAGTQNFDTSNIEETSSVSARKHAASSVSESTYDLSGRRVTESSAKHGLYLIRQEGKTLKVLLK